MTDLDDRFAAAAAAVQELEERPGNDELLRLYSLYKQGSEGDATGDRPGMLDFVGRAKYDAWASLAGTSQDDAKAAYVELVETLQSARGSQA
ncbi:MAG TPA: acyl-CoA-binding protein [Acidimicrobiia bacterium]|jgi:acyl-CoA-binding protein|nr:acyl-CoA-binding protein [Acidimicrobiia bacterium]